MAIASFIQRCTSPYNEMVLPRTSNKLASTQQDQLIFETPVKHAMEEQRETGGIREKEQRRLKKSEMPAISQSKEAAANDCLPFLSSSQKDSLLVSVNETYQSISQKRSSHTRVIASPYSIFG
ncbi:LOW QUALITY PROTEIN: hypothetical protein NC651_014678 [Populus alba x Populus x berolinensis]|nr:LOW QUALITY PROTEIN: hypothetical protein NC651_014678 [Populus alba x Populus x berolinensis]